MFYSLLTTYYFASKPNITLCRNCNRFFEPKINDYKQDKVYKDDILTFLEEESKNFIPYIKNKHETDW